MTEWIDEDGYPTEDTIAAIRLWAKSSKGLMEFIKPLWRHADVEYWREEDYIDELTKKPGIRYHLSTGGWSGNEEILYAMQDNMLFWSICWVQSRRGGHYIFEIRK